MGSCHHSLLYPHQARRYIYWNRAGLSSEPELGSLLIWPWLSADLCLDPSSFFVLFCCWSFSGEPAIQYTASFGLFHISSSSVQETSGVQASLYRYFMRVYLMFYGLLFTSYILIVFFSLHLSLCQVMMYLFIDMYINVLGMLRKYFDWGWIFHP